MSYEEEETTDLRAQVRESALEAAKERSLAEQATQARNTAQAKVRELEAELADSKRLLGGGLTDADWLDLICERYALVPKARIAKAEEAFRQMHSAFNKAEARIAELERKLAKKWNVADSVNAILDAAGAPKARERGEG